MPIVEVGDIFGLPSINPGPPVVEPRSAEEVSKVLGYANEHGWKVVIVGSGSKLDRGPEPTSYDIALSISGMTGVIEHAAGDMTATVRAGTLLSDLQTELAIAGQFLPIDPPFPGTVGGLIATADSGPRRLRYGGVRDLLLGVTFVLANGTVAKGGGKVVKNVAGYDLPKLLTGSFGTLGVITEATFRLYPVPPASATVVSRNLSTQQASSLTAVILTSGLVPTSVDYYSHDGDRGTLAVRFESSPRSVAGQSERAVTMLGSAEILNGDAAIAFCAELDTISRVQPGDILARLITTQSDLAHLLGSAERRALASASTLTTRAHMGHGHALLRLSAPSLDEGIEQLMALRREAQAMQSNLVIWRIASDPSEKRPNVDWWGDPGESLDLMRRVKAQFDPKATLNPGRFVGGI